VLEAEPSGSRNPVIGRFLLAILLQTVTGVWNNRMEQGEGGSISYGIFNCVVC
jgi:hypothetical protein